MKALTVRQPYASLIAAGVKTVVTRPRPVDYRGRIAIYASVHKATAIESAQWRDGRMPSGRIRYKYEDALGPYRLDGRSAGVVRSLPLGAVVASAIITDCVPIVDWNDDCDGTCVVVDGERMWIDHAGEFRLMHIEDQRPFGDFSPGRWALLLDDIAPTTSRCPACWGGVLLFRGDSRPYPCPLCHEKHTCDPVPARGRSGLWEWTP